MLGKLLCLVVLIPLSGSWATSRNYSSDWMKKAVKLGLTSGHIELKYSLTDECELGDVEVLESTNEQLYTSEVVDEIVRDFVGPFDYMGDTLPGIVGTDDRTSKKLAFNKRKFSWQNEFGHEYLECSFYLDGQLFDAEFVDANRAPAEFSPAMKIEIPLSEIAPVVRRFAFRFED